MADGLSAGSTQVLTETPSPPGELPTPVEDDGSSSGGPKARPRWSWSRILNASAIVAVLGLVFTVVSFVLENRAQDRADQRAARTELTQVIQAISQLPRHYASVFSEPAESQPPINALDDAEATSLAAAAPQVTVGMAATQIALGSAHVGELRTLVTQADRIISDFPEIVTSNDVLVTGNGHLQTQDFTRAVDRFVLAERMAIEENTEVGATAARRGLGLAFLSSDRMNEGRDAFERALRMDGFDSSVAIRQGNFLVTIYQWIGAEVGLGNCDFAEELTADEVAALADIEWEDVSAHPVVPEVEAIIDSCQPL